MAQFITTIYKCIILPSISLIISSCGSKYLKKGVEFEQQGDWEQAIENYEKAYTDKPKDKEIQRIYAEAKHRYANKILEDAVYLCDSKIRTLGRANQCIGEAERALNTSDRCVEAKTFLNEWRMTRASINSKLEEWLSQRDQHLKNRAWEKAISAMQAANKLDPDNSKYVYSISDIKKTAFNSYFNSSHISFQKREYHDATEHINKALLFKRNSKAQKFKQKIEDAVKAEEMYPSANQLVMRREYKDAIPLLTKIQVLNPDKVEAARDLAICYFNLGLSFESVGQIGSAVDHFTKAVKTDPEHVEAKNHLKKNRDTFYKACSNQIRFFQSNNLPGNSYLYLKTLSDNHFKQYDNIDIKTASTDIAEEIREHSIPKVTILDFQKKTHRLAQMDLSLLMPDQIYESLRQMPDRNFDLVERGRAIDSIKEAGIRIGRQLSTDKIQAIGKVLESEIVITGEITDFNYKKDFKTSQRSERYLSGYRNEYNPEYDVYKTALGIYEMCQQQRAFNKFLICIPPMHKPNQFNRVAEYADCHYTVEKHTLRANMGVTYRVYDSIRNKFIFNKTITSQDSAYDNKTNGCERANVSYDPLELPHKEEFISKVVDENIYRFISEYKRVISKISSSYYERGQNYEKASNPIAATEDYVTAFLLDGSSANFSTKMDNLQSQVKASITPAMAVATQTRTSPPAQEPTQPAHYQFKGRKHAVIIGINDYASTKIPKLKYAQNDALMMQKTLLGHGCGFRNENVKLLLGRNATMRNIKSNIGTLLARNVAKDDIVFIFFAGHGAPESDMSGRAPDGYTKYLLPYDADPEDLYSTAIPFEDIANFFRRIDAENIIFVTDACYSGASGGRTFLKGRPRSIKIVSDYMDTISSGSGHVIITASDANEPSLEIPRLNHGLFTFCFTEGLKGKADFNRDKIVTLDELYKYVSTNVSKNARKMGNVQHPVLKGNIKGQIVMSRLP